MLEKPVLVRNPGSIRPWQHVLECLSGYLWLAARLSSEPKSSHLISPFNFGPEPSARQPVKRLVEEILSIWPGTWVDGSVPNSPHEATLLTLSIEKAVAQLGWQPAWGFKEAIQRTIFWYYQRHMTSGADMLKLSKQQILDYAEAARGLNLAWAR
jgi:CDP-glucose 4,6-dehydratase